MRKLSILAILVFGIALLALAAQQAQKVQKPPAQKQIDKTTPPAIPAWQILIRHPEQDGIWFKTRTDSIAWTKMGIQPDNVKIELRDQQCLAGVLVIAESTANDGNHPWAPPETIPDGPYSIRISGAGVQRCSERFYIRSVPWKLTVPPGATWKSGSTHTVTWMTTQPASVLVDLRIGRMNDEKGIPIQLDTPNDGAHSFKVPEYGAATCWISITGEYPGYGEFEARVTGITIVP